MRNFEFKLVLTEQQTRTIYAGRSRYILVESLSGEKLQLPAHNFREYVSAEGIRGRFSVTVDASNKISCLRKI